MRLPNKHGQLTALVDGYQTELTNQSLEKQGNALSVILRIDKSKFEKARKCFKCYLPRHISKNCLKGVNSIHKRPDGDAFMCQIDGITGEDLWLADSCASAHITK